MLVLNKNVCEDHTDLIQLFLECTFEYIVGRPERGKNFSKIGGVKRLRSLPKFLLEKGDIVNRLNLILSHIANIG